MEIKQLLTILKNGESDLIEFKEQLIKKICQDACAFANTNGGHIFIGVKNNGTPVKIKEKDYQQKISNFFQSLIPVPKFEIQEILFGETKLIIILIHKSAFLVSYKNRVYIRAGTNSVPLSITDVIEKAGESLHAYFDKLITKIPVSKLDKNLFIDYLRKREVKRGISAKGSYKENAVQLNAIKCKGKNLFFTNAGLLCFVLDPQRYINNAVVRLTWFEDEEMENYREQKEFTGPLPGIVNDLEKFFVSNLHQIGGFTTGFRRQGFLEYPIIALKEAIINAIVHRNYFDRSDIRIFIFPTRIEIKNPGSFPPGVSIEDPEHKPRNPIIAQYFYDLGLSDRLGSGLKRMIKESKQHPLSNIRFDIKPYMTTVIFEKNTKNISLDKINQNIINFLAGGNKQTRELTQVAGLSRQATISRLKDLIALGFVDVIGSGPKTFYKLNKILK